MSLPGTVPSPNIWEHPAVYEIENNAVDRAGHLETQMRQIHDWSGQSVLDIGCGTGFHLPRFARTARTVVGVEPHERLAVAAVRRLTSQSMSNAVVRQGTAQKLPVADGSIDVAHARWAYFFGPGCEPGLAELNRVMRRGGTAFIIDNDATTSTFGNWFSRAFPAYGERKIEHFFSSRGWTRQPVLIDWTFDTRADLEAVVRIEFTPVLAGQLLSEVAGLTVDYAINLWFRHF